MKKEDGFTLIELLAAVVILSIVSLSMTAFIINAMSYNKSNQSKTVMVNLALLTAKAAEKATVAPDLTMKQIQEALPVWDNIEQLTLDLQQIGQEAQVTMSTFTFAINEKNQLQTLMSVPVPASIANVKEIKVNAVLVGTYKDVMDYVNQLQKMSRLVTVDTLSFNAVPKDETKKMSVSITFTVYFDPSYKKLVVQVESPYK